MLSHLDSSRRHVQHLPPLHVRDRRPGQPGRAGSVTETLTACMRGIDGDTTSGASTATLADLPARPSAPVTRSRDARESRICPAHSPRYRLRIR